MNNKLLQHFKQDWYVYAALLLALIALLYTIANQANTEANIRAEYETYIEDCNKRTGGTIWNEQNYTVYYTPYSEQEAYTLPAKE